MKKILLVLMIAFLLPAQVFAANGKKLLKYAPNNSKVVFGVDVMKVKGTPLFKKGMAYLRSKAASGSALHFALNNGVVDIEKNVSSVLVASKAPKGMNPNNIKPSDSVIIVDGNFELEKIKATLLAKNKSMTERKSKSGFDILTYNQMEIGLLNATTIIVASNKNAATAWATAQGGKSVNDSAKVSAIIRNTDINQGIWAIASIASTPKLKGTSISGSLKSGLALTAKTWMAKAADAKEAKSDLEKMVAKQGGIAKAFGAGELVDNLKLDIQKQKWVRIRTKISNGAVLKLVKQLETMAKQQMKAQKNKKKPRAMPKKKGTSADFN